ncbi:MAG: peroxiredoxin [Bacteroidetes bacterium]|nr:MAG: peroxiredoxin [Bacteroidota bacterium]PTM12082.1 MAG: peroxiredoxin [Bacteroidota bacterium]
MIKYGDKAPAFQLVADDLKPVALSDSSGKNVVLLFFPMAFTGVCTAELCSMRDNMADYAGLDAQILAISVDSPFTLTKFKADQSLNFPLLSDFNKEVSRNYGTLYEEFVLGLRGVSKRSAFVIDKEGTVRYAEVLESAGDLPNFTAVRETLASL